MELLTGHTGLRAALIASKLHLSNKLCSHNKPWGAITENIAMTPLKRAANISSSNVKTQTATNLL